jgi:hypothetical protein
MGYYTNYELEIVGGHKDVIEEIVLSDEDTFYGIDADGSSIDSVKWYGHEEDFKTVSKKYPELVFKLKGEGEEAGDVWIKYFKNGKMQSCPAKITFDEFDISKLK